MAEYQGGPISSLAQLLQQGPPHKAFFDRLGLEEGWQPKGAYDKDAYAVKKDAEIPPWGPTKAEARSLPPASILGPMVSDDPTFQSRLGRLEAGAISAADSLGFGMPSAIAHRVAPNKAESLDKFLRQYSNSNLAASVAAGVVNPANAIYRAGGNALAAKGYGIGSQATADGATLMSMAIAPNIIKDGGLGNETGSTVPATTAMAARFLMPTLPDVLLKRIAGGAVAGALGAVPESVYQDQPMRIPVGAAVGGAYGSQLRMRPGDIAANANGSGVAARADARDKAATAALISSVPGTAGGLWSMIKNAMNSDKPWPVHNDHGYQGP